MYEAKENLFDEPSMLSKVQKTKSSNDVQEFFKVEEEKEFDFLSDEEKTKANLKQSLDYLKDTPNIQREAMQIQGTTPIRIMKKDRISGMYKTQALSKQLKNFKLSFAEEEKLPAANQT